MEEKDILTFHIYVKGVLLNVDEIVLFFEKEIRRVENFLKGRFFFYETTTQFYYWNSSTRKNKQMSQYRKKSRFDSTTV